MITLKLFLSVLSMWIVAIAYIESGSGYDYSPKPLKFVFECLSGALATSFIFFIFYIVWFKWLVKSTSD